ncbi:cell growth-regulating nucleolar protein [Malassezia restricta]|nr:cell growth-regulating nucleolar protein [Malassezia restricta]AXA50159.1 cell growth-regulating nucleolar protein [Malassezia restricta]
MVSFVCDGCGDVVKKPKLQQHYNRCFSPVTCLDCSTQFGSPKEAHSSCMTEDEKYQKSLFKGKKNQKNSQANPQPSQKPEHPVKRAAEDPQDSFDKRAKAEMPMEQDTSSKSASKELSPALLKATVVHLAKANKAISLSDIIKYLTKEKGMNKKDVKNYMLKKACIYLEQDRLIFA